MADERKRVVVPKRVPLNAEAENIVLGSVLIDNNIIDTMIGKIQPDDFYIENNRAIFKAMLALRDEGTEINPITVEEKLKIINYNVTDQFREYLIELIDEVPSVASVASYVEVVENTAIERKLLKKMAELSDDILQSKEDIHEMLEKCEREITNIVKLKSRGGFVELKSAATDVLNKIMTINKKENGGLTGLDTGYPNLNKTTLGFQNGDLMILAARPSVGKSTYAINLALNVAKINKAHVAFFSLEMSIEQLLMRIYSLEAGIELGNIRKGELDAEKLTLLKLAEETLKKTNIYFDESSSTNIADIRSKCRQLKQQGRLDFLIIDYLQLITTSDNRGNRQEEVSKISRQLKRLAQELQIPILALSQLSRHVEEREDKRPQLSDLRESGSIEQDADIVMFIYRRSDVEDQSEANALNEKVEELSKITKPKDDKRMLEIIISIAKNRQGSLDDFDYHFYGSLCKFSEQEVYRKPIAKRREAKGMRRLN